jgi:hypothetical protein
MSFGSNHAAAVVGEATPTRPSGGGGLQAAEGLSAMSGKKKVA